MKKPPLKKTPHRFFDRRPAELPKNQHDQNITINITVNEQKDDDSVTDCLKTLFKCFKG